MIAPVEVDGEFAPAILSRGVLRVAQVGVADGRIALLYSHSDPDELTRHALPEVFATAARSQAGAGTHMAISLPPSSRKRKRRPPGKSNGPNVTAPPAASTRARASSRSGTRITMSGAGDCSSSSPCTPTSMPPPAKQVQ